MKIPPQSVRQMIGTIGWSPSSCKRALARLLVVGLLLGGLTGPGNSTTLSGPNSGPAKETSKGAPVPSRAPKRKTAQDAVPTGQLVAQGTVYLNEVVVLSGATVFSNTLVRQPGDCQPRGAGERRAGGWCPDGAALRQWVDYWRTPHGRSAGSCAGRSPCLDLYPRWTGPKLRSRAD